MPFSAKITAWFAQHKRDLPWRNTKLPYPIWLSEIILQQTRVAQGLPYYEAFIKAYPKVEDLAQSSEEEVLKLWQGLGYYSRARNMHATAKYITQELNGNFPDSKKELLKLKGVGDYTASAIASFAFDEAVAVVDGNVDRVLSRVFGVDLPVNEKAGKNLINEKANEVLDTQRPALHNQAIMEFGALQCKPKNPDCLSCPLQNQCVAFQQGKVDVLPFKIKKTKVKIRYLSYFVFVDQEQNTLLQQRKGKGIWENLYEFPNVESTIKSTQKNLHKELTTSYQLTLPKLKKVNSKPIIHLLSHRKLIADFYWVQIDKMPEQQLQDNQKKVAISHIKDYPVPVLIANFIDKYLL